MLRCKQTVDWWLRAASTPIRALRVTVVVGGCFIAGSAQLLRPATYTTYHRQTDGAGSQSGVGWVGEGVLRGLGGWWGLRWLLLCQDMSGWLPIPPKQTTFTFLRSSQHRPAPPCMFHAHCRQCSAQIQGLTNIHSEKLLGLQEPEWPIFSHFSLMRAIKSTRHQYFSALISQAAVFPFDEAHRRCFCFFVVFFLPGCHSDHMWTQEARELDRQGTESLTMERLLFSDSTKSARLNSYFCRVQKEKKKVFLNCCCSGCITSSSADVSIQSKQPDADGLRFPEGLGYVRLVPHTEAGQTSPDEPWKKNAVCCSPAMGVSRWGRFHWRLRLPWHTPAASAPF